MRKISAFMIAGTHSGCGKTTVSLGIMASLVRKGFKVQAFKVGPDFIDPGHHRMITGRPSHNLDGWIMDKSYNQSIFYRYSSDADVAVVEGVMGFYDGISGDKEDASSAQIAKWLNLSVILVVDASSAARSIAAVCLGYKMFDPEVNIIGFIFNNVASPYHAQVLKEAAKDKGINVVGILYREKENIGIPSRHLGLFTAEEFKVRKDKLADWIEKGINIERILKETEYKISDFKELKKSNSSKNRDVRIGIAKDRAFCFYYDENIRLLEEAGAEIIPFSPIEDKKLPLPLDGLIFGGGYPELSCKELSSNTQLMEDIKRLILKGTPVYAECGGFMYLMDSVVDLEGNRYKMLGIFPFECHMQKRLVSLGYRQVTTKKDSILGPAGTTVRGHEFHYSKIKRCTSNVDTIYSVTNRINKEEGYLKRNVLGSYIHLHFGSNPEVAKNFVEYCRKASQGI